MYQTNLRTKRALAKPRNIIETVLPSFKHRTPFAFICNPKLAGGWTPDALFEKKGITSFGCMAHVVVYLNTENLDHALELIESWIEADHLVHVKLPATATRPQVGDSADNHFMGLDVEDCYLPGEGGFVPTEMLKNKIRGLFTDDKYVTVVD